MLTGVRPSSHDLQTQDILRVIDIRIKRLIFTLDNSGGLLLRRRRAVLIDRRLSDSLAAGAGLLGRFRHRGGRRRNLLLRGRRGCCRRGICWRPLNALSIYNVCRIV